MLAAAAGAAADASDDGAASGCAVARKASLGVGVCCPCFEIEDVLLAFSSGEAARVGGPEGMDLLLLLDPIDEAECGRESKREGER